MEYRNLGTTDLKVSQLCMGTMQFGWTADEAMAQRILSAAFDHGINFIDTADIYSRWADGNPGGVAEQIVGRWLKQAKIPREKTILATKVRGNMGGGTENEGLSARHIKKAVDGSLKRLQTDYIDLYQAHWPDEVTLIEETLGAFDELAKQGKIRHAGASNFPAWEVMRALWRSDREGLIRFECLQPHYNLVHRDEFERELVLVCKTYRLGVIPYSPLAGGFLTGKYRRNLIPSSSRAGGAKRYFTEKNWTLLEKMDLMGKEKNASISQIALAWLLSDPIIISPIIGANSVDQLNDNLGALKVSLSLEEKNILDEASSWKDKH
jgi:aryl-alcohol dehydrogenase-like predicted oxidoreductase